MIFGFLATIGSALSDLTSKFILDVRQFSVRKYLPLLFLFLAVVTAFTLPWLSWVKPEFANLRYILLFIGMVIAAVSWNIPFYTSLKKEALHEFELVMLMTPVVTVILAAIIFPDERALGPFFAAIIAAMALVVSRLRKHHLVLTQNIKRTLTAMFFIAVEAVILKELLHVYSPALLYFLRTSVMTIVYFILYRPKISDYKAQGKINYTILLSAVFGVIYMVSRNVAFADIGVVKTTLILLLAPILNYGASYYYFKEKRMFKRDFGAALVILLCVAYVTLVK